MTKKEPAGEYVDDAAITTKVKAAVLGDSSLKSAEINGEAYKGIVQWSGFVSSRALDIYSGERSIGSFMRRSLEKEQASAW